MKSIDATFQKRSRVLQLLPVAVVFLLLLLPATVSYIAIGTNTFATVFLQSAATAAVFVIPLVFFYKNIPLYFYLLTVWVIASPVFVFAVLLLNVPLNFSFVALLLQTNMAELNDATKGYKLLGVGSVVFYTATFLAAVKMTPVQLPFKKALFISTAGLVLFTGYALTKKFRDYYKVKDVLEEVYPLSILSGLYEAFTFMKKNNLEASKNFSFHAQCTNKTSGRSVFVFIIGESSRFDRWSINGYERPTSPRLRTEENLISFQNVTSGCNVTWMSVPQMITRANPTNINLQFTEKSILAAFKEAGYKTVWLSNQSDKELFWSGSITLHAKTADVAVFEPQQSLPSGKPQTYDARLLPVMDSILQSDDKNVFIVLHTMGNHWDYSDRYPTAFDTFKPSGKAALLNPFSAAGKEAISNSYDNSILYADFFIDCVIQNINRLNVPAAVTFLSDHGDDIFELNADKTNFHLLPAETTLHVPLFIWTSESYRKQHAQKVALLQAHRTKKIGPENTFYSLLNLADISYPQFDFTKSIADASFRESAQQYYDNVENRAFLYSRFLKHH